MYQSIGVCSNHASRSKPFTHWAVLMLHSWVLLEASVMQYGSFTQLKRRSNKACLATQDSAYTHLAHVLACVIVVIIIIFIIAIIVITAVSLPNCWPFVSLDDPANMISCALIPPFVLSFLASPGIPLHHVHNATSFDNKLELAWCVHNLQSSMRQHSIHCTLSAINQPAQSTDGYKILSSSTQCVVHYQSSIGWHKGQTSVRLCEAPINVLYPISHGSAGTKHRQV